MLHKTKQINMIESQLKPNNILSEDILESFLQIKQEDFLNNDTINFSYIDDNLRIFKNRFLLRPLTFAKLLSSLNLSKQDTILEVGSSSGYTTAILCNLGKFVYSIEENNEGKENTINNLKKYNFNNFEVHHKSFREENVLDKKIDKIIINGSVNKDPKNFLNLLKDNGILVCILKSNYNSNIFLYKKINNQFEKIKLSNVSSPLLINYIDKEEFVF